MKKILVAVVVMLLLALVAVPFADADATAAQVPLKGTIQGVESHVITFPTMSLNATGSGLATLLGALSFHYSGVVNLTTSTSTGLSARLVAANGDTLTAEGHGHATPTGDISYVTEWYTITGGTGRFSGATGSFTLNRQVNRVTGATFGEFDGSIVLR